MILIRITVKQFLSLILIVFVTGGSMVCGFNSFDRYNLWICYNTFDVCYNEMHRRIFRRWKSNVNFLIKLYDKIL